MKDGRDTYIRSPPDNSPIMKVTSPDMYCNVNGNSAAPQKLAVKAGDNVTFEWFMDTRKDEIIDASHKGPRQHTIVVPDVPAGDYILRAEIITLHLADTVNSEDVSRGAAFYPGCVQVKVTSEGSLKLPGNAAFPGAYTEAEPSLHLDIREAGPAELLAYKAPGPAVWSEAAGGSIGSVGKSSAQTSSKPTVTTPGSTGDQVELWGQCGGVNYHGPKTCVPGAACVVANSLYHHCRPNNGAARKSSKVRVPLWGQCGGKGYA
ncbi:endoglucanase B [Coprinopsis sp. MPI-PUGE-AT-0042]|nr:endoglucanase B [Coprinopsis sp. MPI-PUGE-AT-0042]